jgi:hypothetical protein
MAAGFRFGCLTRSITVTKKVVSVFVRFWLIRFENRHSKIQYGAGLEYLAVQK